MAVCWARSARTAWDRRSPKKEATFTSSEFRPRLYLKLGPWSQRRLHSPASLPSSWLRELLDPELLALPAWPPIALGPSRRKGVILTQGSHSQCTYTAYPCSFHMAVASPGLQPTPSPWSRQGRPLTPILPAPSSLRRPRGFPHGQGVPRRLEAGSPEAPGTTTSH